MRKPQQYTYLLLLVTLPAGLLPVAVPSAPPGDDAASGAGALRPIPAGWRLVFHETFDTPRALDRFEFANPEKWRRRRTPDGGALECLGPGRYRPPVRAPRIMALIRNLRFRDFILEADLTQNGREYPHRDLCIFLDVRSPSRFYYVHIASRADPHAHNIFIVNDRPRRAIAAFTTRGVHWGGREQKHRVRIERRAESGVILVWFDDPEKPIMRARDTTFPDGAVGFGSFDDSGLFDNIRIWAPEPPAPASPVFPTSRQEQKTP